MHSMPNCLNTQQYRFLLITTLLIVILNSACSALIVTTAIAGAGTTLVTDRRPMATMLEDQTIEMKITDAIYADNELAKQVNVEITSFNGIVLVTGEAPSSSLRDKIETKITRFDNVKKVFNEIKIAPRASFHSRSHDAWLTTKVKARLVAQHATNTHTKVVTAHRVAYLFGLLNKSEADKVTQIAAKTEGIERVVTLFEESMNEPNHQPIIAPIETPVDAPVVADQASPLAPQQANVPTPSTPPPIPLAEQPLWTPEEEDDDITILPYIPDHTSIQLTNEL